jgi:hypothetical protein
MPLRVWRALTVSRFAADPKLSRTGRPAAHGVLEETDAEISNEGALPHPQDAASYTLRRYTAENAL